MYRTDKQFMKNPATAPSRIYIGGIPKVIIADDLEAKFSKHGKILGLVINSGFAFIQYEFEEEAKNAIRLENGSVMMGRKIIVRQAYGGKDSNINTNKGPPLLKLDVPPPRVLPPVAKEIIDNNSGPVDIKPIQFEAPLENNDMETQEEEIDSGPNIRPPQKFDDDRQQRGATKNNRGGIRQNRTRAQPEQQREFISNDTHGERGTGNYYEDFGPDITTPSDRNDCEIIVVSRALTEYAEFIESRLKHIGLIVDLLFPNEDVPIGKVLANISSRGCLYAILVMPQNEEHRSMTLNILHGLPQEHRNMPLDDAFLLIRRNFEAYMRGEKPPEDPVKMSLQDRHPAPVQMLFNLLAENRMLTTVQYDRLIKYLQERRELQRSFEVAEGVVPDPKDVVKDKQDELQNRILSILNKSSETPIPTSITAPETQEPPTPLLKDPSVQKALDSILSGDMFKSIAGDI